VSAPEGSLAAVLAGVDRLRCGEAVAVFAPLADALAAVHADGAAHRRISGAWVRLTAGGAAALGPPEPAGRCPAGRRAQADDVRDLAALLIGALLGLAAPGGAGADPVAGPGGGVGLDGGVGPDGVGLGDAAGPGRVCRGGGVGFGGAPGSGGPPAEWLERAFALGVPAALVAVLASALAVEPERRPGAGELAAALRATCDPLPLDRLFAADRAR